MLFAQTHQPEGSGLASNKPEGDGGQPNSRSHSQSQKEADKLSENLHWLGHSSFRFDGSKIIYFDPWKLPKNSKKADLIFISHEHFDHFSPEDVSAISSSETVIITDKAVSQWFGLQYSQGHKNVSRQLQGKVNCKEVKGLSPGETVEVSQVKVQAVASYNIGKEFHTKDSRKLGFIVTIDGITIYHAGDTDNIPQMKDYRCDLALLPVSGTYVMTAEEAAEAALAIKPRIAVPMHYGDIVGSPADAQRFKELLKGKIEVRILKQER